MIIQMVLVFTCDKRYVDWLHCVWGKVVINFREVGENLGADRAVKCAELLYFYHVARVLLYYYCIPEKWKILEWLPYSP